MSTLAMSPRWRPSAGLSYGLAVCCVDGAWVVSALLPHLMVDVPPWYAFVAVVLISIWGGGLGPGRLAGLLSTLTLAYFCGPPLQTFSLNIAYLPGLLGFGLSALRISGVTTKRRHAGRLLRHAHAALGGQRARADRRTPAHERGLIDRDCRASGRSRHSARKPTC
jgi:K+-sensing histidine kinase KdpD